MNSTANLHSHLSRLTKTLQTLAAATYRDPRKHNIHQLRVTVRRVRAVLWLTEHADAGLEFSRLNSRLRKLGRALGKARELDVALDDSAKFQLPKRELKEQRRSARLRVRAKVDERHRHRLQKDLAAALDVLAKTQDLSPRPGLVNLRRKISPWVKKKELSHEDLHEVRILSKKMRYALEAAGHPSKPLVDLQDLLGKGHDLEVLQILSGKNRGVESEMNARYAEAKRALRPKLRAALAKNLD